jgi:hypothetical protein
MMTSAVQQLEGVIVAPTGITEALLGARVFGWHALAQAYLSELTAADADASKPAVAEERSASTETVVASPEDPDAESPDSALTEDATEGASVVPDVGISTQDQQRVASDDTASIGALESVALDAQAPSYWAERSLRLIRQRDGGVVAWLRDFRADDTDAPLLVKAVLSEAKAKGFALNKVMLNGREVWSSPISH